MNNDPTIDSESARLLKHNSDVDFFRRYYSAIEQGTDSESDFDNIKIKFVSPVIQIYKDYYFFLLENSIRKQLQPQYFYRPDYISYNEYGTTNYWALLLYLNDLHSIEEFKIDTVLIPTKESLSKLALQTAKRNLNSEIVLSHLLPDKPTPPLWTLKTIIPKIDIVDNGDELIPSDLYFQRENFSLNLIQLRQRYIDLIYQPVIESVILKINDHGPTIYNKHFKIIRGNRGLNRLTWDPRQIPNGIGCIGIMQEALDIEIQYARKI